MARQRRDLDTQLADLLTMTRNTTTISLGVPGMAALGPNMIEDNAILNEHLSAGAVALENLDSTMQEAVLALTDNGEALEGAVARLTAAEGRINSLVEEVPSRVEEAKQAAIEAAKAYTDANGGGGGGGVSPEELEALRLDAQAKADAAEAAAKADTISKMNDVANSKNATFYGTAIPTATAPPGGLAGDTYRRRNAAGNIIGEWEWVVTNNTGAWVQRKITSESMTAIDVGVLSAGTAVLDDAVARKIAAATASFQTADIGNLTVTGTTNMADAVAERIAANTAAFIKVSTDNLIAGNAAMDTATAQKMFADLMAVNELTAENINVTGLMDGERIIGASVETDANAATGVKMNTEGVTAHGTGTGEIGGAEVPFNTRATLTQRATGHASNPDDRWPGLWLEGSRKDGEGTPPTFPAGVSASDALAEGVAVHSAQTTEVSANTRLVLHPEFTTLSASTARPGPTTPPSSSSGLDLSGEEFSLTTRRPISHYPVAGVEHTGDGILRLSGENGVMAGKTLMADSGWLKASYLSGWTDYGMGFGGLQYRLLNGVLSLRGTIKGGVRDSLVTTLPVGFRPVLPTGATAMEFPISATQGGSWYAGSMYAYATGNLVYNAPPGVWGGSDRVVINASFPL